MNLKNLLLMAVMAGFVAPASSYADDYVDDIYFNPKKDKNVGAKKKNPNYIENFSDMDVDAYNLRGQYYTTPIDTIGAKVSADEDFVYTQQIQKYYNPTIVLDNSQLLADVLQNSYGNVEIVYNGLTPAFLPTYGYGWPYYAGYYNPWSWNIGGWGWSIGGWYDPWYWGPSWSWGWGPSWSWGPSWAWGPSWGWGGPGWGPAWGGPGGTWSPGGNRPVNPGLGWAGNHRHPGSSARPGSQGVNRPASSGSQWSIGGNHRGSYGSAGMNSNRQPAPSSGNNRGYTIGNDGHRYRGTGSMNSGNNSGNRNTGTVGNNRNSGNSRGNSYNSNTNSNRNGSYNNSNTRNSGSYNNSNTRNSGSYNNSSRSSGNGSFGGGSFGGSRGGGGGRGGRR